MAPLVLDLPTVEDVESSLNALELLAKQYVRLFVRKRAIEIKTKRLQSFDLLSANISEQTASLLKQKEYLQESWRRIKVLLKAAVASHSTAWCGHLASKMLQCFPREIRDIIYEYLIALHFPSDHIQVLDFRDHKFDHFFRAPRRVHQPQPPAIFDIQTMGFQVAEEMRERFSGIIPVLVHQHDFWQLMHMDECRAADLLCVRFNYLRHIIINLCIGLPSTDISSRYDSERYSNSENFAKKVQAEVKKFDQLLDLPNPARLRLEIRLDCRYQRAVDAFEKGLMPVVELLKQKGMGVTVVPPSDWLWG